jgi:hypothetical protein
MVTLVKHEHHQVDAQFAYELDEVTLGEIYPDLDEEEIALLMKQIEAGEIDLDCLLQEAADNGVEIEWCRQYDDWWTDRKGGYEVTFEVGDESSWHEPEYPPEPTHKCTKCKWTGRQYDARWIYPQDDDDEFAEGHKICPMCDSELSLTEHGIVEEEAHAKRMAEIDAMFTEDTHE